jgi:hypothetical protein
MGHPQAYGVVYYLDDSLFDNSSFPMKKLHHIPLSHLFLKWMTLEGTKENMHAIIKPPNKILYKVSREYIKFPTFTKYQKSQKESTRGSNEYSKQQNTECVLKNNKCERTQMSPRGG